MPPFDHVFVPYSSDIDECTTGAAQCHYNASCVNIPGSFSCVCDSGYTGDGIVCNGKLCIYCFYWKILILTLNKVHNEVLCRCLRKLILYSQYVILVCWF